MRGIRKLLTNILTVVLLCSAGLSSYGAASQTHAAISHGNNTSHHSKMGHKHEAPKNFPDQQDCFYVCVEAVSVFNVKEFASVFVPPEPKEVLFVWADMLQSPLLGTTNKKSFLAQGPPGLTSGRGLERLLRLNARLRY